MGKYCRGQSISDRGRSKRCRAFYRRTFETVRTASQAWGYIFDRPAPQFTWVEHKDSTCSDLAREVKTFLGSLSGETEEATMAFQSIKKMLPDSCRCMESGLISKLVDNLSRPGGDLPKGYLRFVEREVQRMFPKGWDTSYEGYCLRTSPPLSATTGSARAKGGCLGSLTEKWSQHDFLDIVLGGRGEPCKLFAGEMVVVQSAGKPRPLSKFPAEALVMRPLHKLIYGHLSKQKWLLRGTVDRAKLQAAGFKAGAYEVLVSGDYSSATDNLPLSVLERALETMLKNCSVVPQNIKNMAKACIHPWMFSPESSFTPAKGQMMGSYLSFPFLCLQNYLAFRWACKVARIREKLPLLINGDDILFQASSNFARLWMDTVGGLGLEVERTKTSIAVDYGSLNSTLLRWNDEGLLDVVPTLRFGMLRPADYPHNLGKSFEDFLRGQTGDIRWRAGRKFFDYHVGELRAQPLSLPSLGFRGSLAHRLARIYGLLGRPDGELPRPPRVHSVELPRDLVCEVPLDAVSEEVRNLNAIETAAWKWTTGFQPAAKTSEAIQYCLEMSSLVPTEPIPLWAFWASDSEFSWRLRNLGRKGVISRRSQWKSFCREDEIREKVTRIHYRLVCELEVDFGRGELPSYDQSQEETVMMWTVGR
uniref:RNA-dependent RNA polymerase n=1 Tax=Suillus luteus botourmiavirus 1 TaxID=3067802 RepID=A0AA49X772_9VIRU|nr:RNA-dependent RNA polymerase [Suillus luteus botourmiavirus 1]